MIIAISLCIVLCCTVYYWRFLSPKRMSGCGIQEMDSFILSDEQIQRRAKKRIEIRSYYLWNAAGRPSGDGKHFWLQAEQEENQLTQTQTPDIDFSSEPIEFKVGRPRWADEKGR